MPNPIACANDRKNHGTIALPLACWLATLSVGTALLQDWYVDINAAGCATGTGTQADPFCDIMDAVAAAADGDTIHIAEGTYVENVVLDKNLSLIGTAGPNLTIINGSAGGSVVWVQYTLPDVWPDPAVTLTGLTLTNGTGTDNGYYSYGGGLLADDLTAVTGCLVVSNSAYYGGGVSGRTRLEDSTVSGNSAQKGGGIHSWSTRIMNSAVTGNTATSGGGIYVSSYLGSVILTNSTVSGNLGDGIFTPGSVTIGGSFAWLNNSVVTGNSGSGIRGNFGVGGQGAFLTNSLISDNSDAGLKNVGSFSITNTTITRNAGGGVVGGGGDIWNSILWENGPGSILGCSPYCSYITADRTLIQGGWAGTGNLDTDPLFVDPTNGNYRLMPGSPCIDAGDNLAVPLGPWPYFDGWSDLDGKRRFIDDPLTPDTGRGARRWPIVDMGAYEFGNDPPWKVRQR